MFLCWAGLSESSSLLLESTSPTLQLLLDAATATSGAKERSSNAPGRCNCCSWGHNAPAMLPDAAIAASDATRRSCNAPKRCSCYFFGHRTFL